MSTQGVPVRLLIVASVRLYREGLSRLLQESPSVQVVGVAATPAAAWPTLSREEPDVVLVDVPKEIRSITIRAILDRRQCSKVVAFGVPEVEGEVIELAEAGAVGYVSDQATVAHLVHAVAAASQGELHCSPKIAAALLRHIGRPIPVLPTRRPAPALAEHLTTREVEVLGLIESGLSNQQIARRLHIALPTVKNHVHSLLRKLHAGSRTEALARFRERPEGLVPMIRR